MENTYFERIERHCQEIRGTSLATITPVRQIIMIEKGREITKKCSQIPLDTLERMVGGATNKYKKMTDQIIHQIQTSKRKGTRKYQTLGWKQAKEIQSWCHSNNINCSIVQDTDITRNKLQSIDIWYDINGELYDDGSRDYERQHLDFRNTKQNVVYVQINNNNMK